MGEPNLSDFVDTDAATFSKNVKAASSSQLSQLMSGPNRDAVLSGVFNRFPGEFRADRAGNTNAIIHWTITGRPDGGSDTYEVVIADGTCVVNATPQHEPKLGVTLSGVDFLSLISGKANPMMMFMTGKLKAKGDLGLAANLAKLFDVQKA